jgi:predicted Rossmann-fold nucleotide-binding protein
MNVAIYCGSSFGDDKIYEESTKLLAQKLAKNNLNIIYGGSIQGLMGIISNESLKCNNTVTGVITHDLINKEIENKNITKIYKVETINQRKEKIK